MIFWSNQLNGTDYFYTYADFDEDVSYVEEVKRETEILQDFAIALIDQKFTKEIPLQFLLDNLPDNSKLLYMLKTDKRYKK